MQKIENAVVDVTTGKKMYVPPQIEVVELAEEPRLLCASPAYSRGFGLDELESDNW